MEGTVYAVFGVMQDGQKKSFTDSLQRVEVSTFPSLTLWNMLFVVENENLFSVCI